MKDAGLDGQVAAAAPACSVELNYERKVGRRRYMYLLVRQLQGYVANDGGSGYLPDRVLGAVRVPQKSNQQQDDERMLV